MWLVNLILISCVGLVLAKPLDQPQSKSAQESPHTGVEIERQILHEVTESPEEHQQAQKKIDANTQEILEKIAQVNKQQGLVKKKPKPNYFHFPFSYSRAQEENQARSSNDFKFSRDPFTNPILDYIEKDQKKEPSPSFRRPNFDSEQHSEPYGFSMTDTNPEINPADNIPGQYIKRKVTHYQSFMMPNPYMMNAPLPYAPPPLPQDSEFMQKQQTIDNIKNLVMKSQLYPQGRQNWNWPGAGMFPIYIRDPFLQMYYAITNMVEYGPTAGNEGPCKLTPRPQGSRLKINSKLTPPTMGQQISFEMDKNVGTGEVKITESAAVDDQTRFLDVEDIDIGDEDLIKFTVNFPPEGRKFSNENPRHDISDKLDFKQVPPMIEVEQLEDETVEMEKADDIRVSNEGSRKVISKDNTGNGIFIHKLKVRKGGVAIAGPGGIATAGSGGTAIVGPDGVAYTHPDGLAIAGSGTKVVAVDPSIDLNEVIKNTVLNGTKAVPNTRVGKVVAVGPVIYYNRGV